MEVDKRTVIKNNGRAYARKDIKKGENPRLWFPFAFYHWIRNEVRDGVVANCKMIGEEVDVTPPGCPIPMPSVFSVDLEPLRDIKKGEEITYIFDDPRLAKAFSTPYEEEKLEKPSKKKR